MILVIGEMVSQFSHDGGDSYRRSFSGIGYEWARRIGKECFFLTVMARDKASAEMRATLDAEGIAYSRDLVSTLPSAFVIDGDRYYRNTAPVSLTEESILESIAGRSFDSVVVSSVLLSYNPSASAVIDTLSFLYPQPRLAIDTSVEIEEGRNIEARAIGDARTGFSSLLVSSDKAGIASFLGCK